MREREQHKPSPLESSADAAGEWDVDARMAETYGEEGPPAQDPWGPYLTFMEQAPREVLLREIRWWVQRYMKDRT